MFSSENNVGRLVELRIASPVTPEEIVDLQRTHLAVLGQIQGDYVIVTDLRRATVFPQEISERFITLMAQVTPRLLRSAILISGSAVLGLQAERAIEEAGNLRRRSFRSTKELTTWLGEVLTDDEAIRLRTFLAAVE
ncbi:MAG: hypothetical protein AAGN66_18840 [Acidobacteriota bacterium]